MERRPIVGINTDAKDATAKAPPYLYLGRGYVDRIRDAGATPILIPSGADSSEIQAILDLVDAMILIGGADLDPRNDGFQLHPSVKAMASYREQSDRALMAEIAERRLPVFGIGAGMQLMNVSQGGNLALNIPDDFPDSKIKHADSLDREHRHALNVQQSSLVYDVFGDGEIRVLSSHHMAIDEVAPGFRATAHAPDGLVEAIECDMLDWLAFGVQFHPEGQHSSALDALLFKEFVERVRASSSSVI